MSKSAKITKAPKHFETLHTCVIIFRLLNAKIYIHIYVDLTYLTLEGLFINTYLEKIQNRELKTFHSVY